MGISRSIVNVTHWNGIALPAGAFTVITSINYYSGTIAIAGSFSGVKDVTISSVTTNHAVVLPAYIAGTNGIHFMKTSVNTTVSRISIADSTTVRFHDVVNPDGGGDTLTYAFWVVEFE